ncbi:MAG: hypothetical protein ACI9EF_002666 [Pseudohongiellaceae bacterium]|jgi:hypothetical protein
MAQRDYVPLFSAISTSSRLASLSSDTARLLFDWLLANCDAWGRMRADAGFVNAQVWPRLHKSDEETFSALAELAAAGLVVLYRDIEEDDLYLLVADWEKKAGTVGRVAHRAPSRCPEPPKFVPPEAWNRASTTAVPAETEWSIVATDPLASADSAERAPSDSTNSPSDTPDPSPSPSVSAGRSQSSPVGDGHSRSGSVDDPLLSSPLISSRRSVVRRVDKQLSPQTAASSGLSTGKASGDTRTKRKQQLPADLHPQSRPLCEHLASAARSWKPDIRLSPTSKTSLSGMDGLLRIDKRCPAKVQELIDWLFGGGYEPDDPAKFDWRPNIRSGASLRKSWDKLDTLRTAHTAPASGEWIGR